MSIWRPDMEEPPLPAGGRGGPAVLFSSTRTAAKVVPRPKRRNSAFLSS